MPLRLNGPPWARALLPLIGALGACTHSEVPTLASPPTEGPFATVSPIRLTFNLGDDAFPVYSTDGASVAYAYAAPSRPDRDRCAGIIPAGGGTRSFSLCEQRVGYGDSTDAITPIGLHADGRLFYMQATTTRFAVVPGPIRVFVTDTTGASSTPLATLPLQVAAGPVSWLGNVHWLSDNEFIALGQQVTAVPRCAQCGAARDTVFIPVSVVRGTVGAQTMTLTEVPGTAGALGYGLNDARTEIVFALGAELFRVAVAGGTPTLVAPLPAGHRFIDLDCGNDLCAVLMAAFPGAPRTAQIGNSLFTVPFGGNTFTARAAVTPFTWWGVRVSPDSPEIVLSVSGASDARDLYLFRGLL